MCTNDAEFALSLIYPYLHREDVIHLSRTSAFIRQCWTSAPLDVKQQWIACSEHSALWTCTKCGGHCDIEYDAYWYQWTTCDDCKNPYCCDCVKIGEWAYTYHKEPSWIIDDHGNEAEKGTVIVLDKRVCLDCVERKPSVYNVRPWVRRKHAFWVQF